MAGRLSFAQFNDGYPPVMDGVVTCVRNYAYWLNQKYGECTLFVPDKRHASYNETYRVVGYRSFPLIRRRPYRVGMPMLDMQYRSALKQSHFDLAHAHSPFSAGVEALRLGKERNIPVVATFHSKYYDDFYAYTKSKALSSQGVRILMRRFEQMDSVWTVSESAAQTLRSYGYRGPVVIMPNGADLVMPENPTRLVKRSDEVAMIPTGVPVFLFVGQMIWQKNIRLILEACVRLNALGARFFMLMVGEGPARRELEALVKKAGLSDCIAFPGVVWDRDLLSALYLRARALVFPSIYDNAPLVIREAAAMSCPSVVVERSNAAQGIRHMENGLLCTNDVQSLCESMRYAVQAREHMLRIGQLARRTLSRSWESIVDDVYLSYRDILRQNKNKAVG